MPKKSIIIILIIAATIVVTATLFFVLKANKKPVKKDTDKWANVPFDNTVFPLQLGSKGKAVKLVQLKLGITADGIFGTQTQGEVIKYYNGGNDQVSKEAFVLLLTSESVDEEDFINGYTASSYAYLFTKIMAGYTVTSLTYDEYKALAAKVFGLQTQDFN